MAGKSVATGELVDNIEKKKHKKPLACKTCNEKPCFPHCKWRDDFRLYLAQKNTVA